MQRTARAAWSLAASLAFYAASGLVVSLLFFLFTDPEASTDAQGGIGVLFLLIGSPWIVLGWFLLLWPPLALVVAWRYRTELFTAEHSGRAIAYYVLLPLGTWIAVVVWLVVIFSTMTIKT